MNSVTYLVEFQIAQTDNGPWRSDSAKQSYTTIDKIESFEKPKQSTFGFDYNDWTRAVFIPHVRNEGVVPNTPASAVALLAGVLTSEQLERVFNLLDCERAGAREEPFKLTDENGDPPFTTEDFRDWNPGGFSPPPGVLP
jgi:hypothetical protein